MTTDGRTDSRVPEPTSLVALCTIIRVCLQVRRAWNSSLAVSVAHCGELAPRHVRWFQDNNVGVLDLCDVEAMGDRDEAGNNLNTILGA
jgi:hypothetical protein